MKQLFNFGYLLLLATLLFTGCEKGIYEDLSHCPQGVDMHFRVLRPAETQESKRYNYPTDEIKQLRLFAFDEQGRLVWDFGVNSYNFVKENLLHTNFYRVGTTRFVAWAGQDLSKYNFGTPKVGSTTLQELMVRMQSQAATRSSEEVAPLYVGTPAEGALTQEDRSQLGTFYDKLHFDLIQLHNTIKVEVKGLKLNHRYQLRIKADNGEYTALGNISGNNTFEYTTNVTQTTEQGKEQLSATFNILKLEEKHSYTVEVLNVSTGQVAPVTEFSGNIIEYILANDANFRTLTTPEARQKMFDTKHSYHITLTLNETPEGHMAVNVLVKSWNFVARDNIIL